MSENITKRVTAEVIAVVPEFHQVIVRTDTGWQYSIGTKTEGVSWKSLVEGDIVEMTVLTAIPIVKKVLNVNKS